MKICLSKSFALGVLLTSAVANSIAIRQDSSEIAILNNLFTTVQTYIGAISTYTLPQYLTSLHLIH
jgi:hypothetical protein